MTFVDLADSARNLTDVQDSRAPYGHVGLDDEQAADRLKWLVEVVVQQGSRLQSPFVTLSIRGRKSYAYV